MKKNAFILQTNWAVYAKAAPLLYAQMTIHMESYDAVCLSERVPVHDIKQWSPDVWRHHPLRGTVSRNAEGVQVYASGEMSGDIEPHIVARFERRAFLARFNIDEDQQGPP